MTAQRARERAGAAAVALRSLARRTVVALSSGGTWQLTGYYGEAVSDLVELFGGIGFHSRPSATSVTAGNPEAVIVRIGGAQGHPVIVATRDESIRASLDEDETAIFNSQAMVKIKSDGTIEASSIGGSPVALALKSELDALASHVDEHRHYQAGTVAGPTSKPVAAAAIPAVPAVYDTAPSATGTTVLKGE